MPSPKTPNPLRLLGKSPVSATVPRILFVDDQPAFAHVLRRFLPCHADCVIVTSALRALRELERGPFDAVVSDLQMPGMRGLELLELVAQRWPAARRILLTGHTSGQLLNQAAPYADATLDKVLEPEILAERICSFASTPRS